MRVAIVPEVRIMSHKQGDDTMFKFLKQLFCAHESVSRHTTSRIQDGSGTVDCTCNTCGARWTEFVANARAWE